MQDVLFSSFSKDDIKALFREVIKEEFTPLIVLKKQQDQQDYLTRLEACKRLGGISLPTLAEYTKNGVLLGKRIGKRVLYAPSDIDAALTTIRTNGKAGEVLA